MRVHFDVHGATADEVQLEAIKALTAFAGDEKTWRFVTVEVHPELVDADDSIRSWRGEVTADVVVRW